MGSQIEKQVEADDLLGSSKKSDKTQIEDKRGNKQSSSRERGRGPKWKATKGSARTQVESKIKQDLYREQLGNRPRLESKDNLRNQIMM